MGGFPVVYPVELWGCQLIRTFIKGNCCFLLSPDHSMEYAICRKTTNSDRYQHTASHCPIEASYNHLNIQSHNNLWQGKSSSWILICQGHLSSHWLVTQGHLCCNQDRPTNSRSRERDDMLYMPYIQDTTDHISSVLKKQNRQHHPGTNKKWCPTPGPSGTDCPQKVVCPSVLVFVSEYPLAKLELHLCAQRESSRVQFCPSNTT